MSEKSYIVSARKYRPATFKSVVGQKNLTATLKNAIDSGRLAQAYLFCGPRGVGKTSCARIFAKTINCLSPTPDGEACGVCESCRALAEGNSFNIVELDAASNNSVDDIRSITEQVNVPPTIGKYRVFIIDEVHMLSSQAFNAFLKTLEEPPSYVIFILATTEKHKVIPTILSRCQIYDFKRITIQDMVEHLQYVANSEGIEADVASLNVIAKKADGAMRDALSIFDQVAASSFGKITYDSTIASLNVLDYEYYFRLVDSFREGDIPAALMIYKEIRDHGFDSLFFINGLANHVRDLMVAYSPQTASLLEVADDVASRYCAQAKSLPVNWHYAAMQLLNTCDYQYRTATNKQFLVELTLIKLCQLLNPPTPPFDRVDSDYIPLRNTAIPPQQLEAVTQQVGSAPTQKSAPVAPQTQPLGQPQANPQGQPQGQGQEPDTDESIGSGVGSKAAAAPVAGQGASPGRHRSVRAAKRNSAVFRLNENSDSDSSFGGTERQRNAVDLSSFKEAWDTYISQNSDKHILISAMRKSQPEQKDAETFRLVVDHPALRQAFDTAMPELLEFLRKTLRNDYIAIDVEIDNSKEVVKQLPPAELLKEIASKNPVLTEFLSDFDGELV